MYAYVPAHTEKHPEYKGVPYTSYVTIFSFKDMYVLINKSVYIGVYVYTFVDLSYYCSHLGWLERGSIGGMLKLVLTDHTASTPPELHNTEIIQDQPNWSV